MIGEDFLFGDTWLSDYGMKMYDPDDEQRFVQRVIERSEMTPLKQIPNHYTVQYSDVLQLHFLIIKDDDVCDSPSDRKLLGEDISLLRAWLESPKVPTKLVVPLESDEMTTNYYGVFTSVQPYIHNQECYGLRLEFTCNAPYGFSDVYTSEYKIQTSNVEFNGRFVNLSAEYNEYMKPVITIKSTGTFGKDESITITNKSDENKKMKITLPEGAKSVTIDCQKKVITDEAGNLLPMSKVGFSIPDNDEYSFLSSEAYVFYWLRLIPNENKLVFLGSKYNSIDTVTIGGQYIIKSGGF